MRLRRDEYWAGFCHGQIAGDTFVERWTNNTRILPALYKNKNAAKRHYEDVRRVRVVEIKPAKRRRG